MPSINISSDLLETTLTPQETFVAMQLANRDLSLCYLQNARVSVFREICSLTFKESERNDSILAHASLMGKLEILDALIFGAMNPTQPPVESANPNQQ